MGGCVSRDAHATAALPSVLETLQRCYDKPVDEVGYTAGHHCLTERDKALAASQGASLLYGELLPAGVSKLLDMEHMDAAHGTHLIDLGMGTGKFLLQAFLQYPNLLSVIGVELSPSRFALAEKAALRLSHIEALGLAVTRRTPGELLRLETSRSVREKGGKRRRLELRRGDMWKIPRTDVESAQIIIMHVEFTRASLVPLRRVISWMPRGSRFVTYNDLTPHFAASTPPFQQMGPNLDEADTFVTSWSASRGHHLFCWEKHRDAPREFALHPEDEEEEESKDEVEARGRRRGGAAAGGGGGGGGEAGASAESP